MKPILLQAFLWLTLFASSASAQARISAVVNAASYGTPVEPGSLISIFGSNFAGSTAAAQGYPLPPSLAGTSVSVNGSPAPLLYVSPYQINAQLPASTAVPYSALGSAQAVVTTASGSSAPFSFQTAPQAPALFTQDFSGCGQAVAFNVTPDGNLSLNSPSNSAQPGDSISVFGTGFGVPVTAVPDGVATPAQDKFTQSIEGELGSGGFITGLGTGYAGLATGMAGVDQVDFVVPQDATQACSVPLTIVSPWDSPAALASPTVWVSIHSGRGACVDPPASSYGQITLTRMISSGTASDGETDSLSATFPSGPGIQAPVAPKMLNSQNVPSPPVSSSRSCAVPGYANLSAGNLTVQPIGQPSISVEPQTQTGGVTYQQALPTGFLHQGTYTLSSASGAGVSFSTGFTIGSPIQIQTSLSPGTTFSASSGQGIQIRWMGGDPGGLIRLQIVTPVELGTYSSMFWTTVDAGSITILPDCQGNPLFRMCLWTFGGANKNNGQLIVDVLPLGYFASTVSAQGLTQGLQVLWMYRYVFGGLNFTN